MKDCQCRTEHAIHTSVQVSVHEERLKSVECIVCNCLVDGKWTNWSNWTSCTATCGNGTKSRMRSCSAPAPQYGGKDCVGEAYAVSDCFLLHCPVHCEWLEFSDWTACSVSCDGGVSTRTRGFVPAQHDGDDCTGDLMEVQDCNTLACPGNG